MVRTLKEIMGNFSLYLSKPSTETVYDEGNIEKSESLSITYGAASMQGWRKCQEDKMICLRNLCKDFSFFGMYDGHGGHEISEYLQENLHFELKSFLETEDDTELALYYAFLSTDESLKDPDNLIKLNAKCRQEKLDQLRKWEAILIKKKDQVDAFLRKQMGVPDNQTSVAGSSKEENTENLAEGSQSSSGTTSVQDSNAVGLSENSNVDNLSNVAGSSKNLDVAGPSLEFDSSTEEEVDDEEDMDEEIHDDTDAIDKPLEYLINHELENSDDDDEEFVVDEDETESDGSDEEENATSKFKLTDTEIANLQPGDFSGSTGTVVLLNGTTIHVANVGDSRCVMSRQGRAEDMTVDHKPTDEEEEKRIKSNGGSVRMGRINNTLDMSRAFGDFKLKCKSLNPPEQLVTCEPNIITLPISKHDEFLVMASDGIWNTMTSQEVVDYVHMRLQQPECDLQDVCDEIFQLCLAPDMDNDGTGADNMTCIIIKFNHKTGSSMVVPTSGTRLTAPLSALGIPAPLCFSSGNSAFPLHSDTHRVYDLEGAADDQETSKD